MRRLVQHGIAGVGLAAFTVTAAVAALGSPAGAGTAIAMPAPAPAVVNADPTRTDPVAEDAARSKRASRDASRARLTASATQQANRRSSTLGQQGASIVVQQQRIAAQIKAEAAAEAKAAAKAKADRKAEAQARRRAAAKAREKAEAQAEVRAIAAARAEEEADARAEAAAEKAAEAREKSTRKRSGGAGTSDPRSIAKQILADDYGFGPEQFSCFSYIIERESMWDVDATNPSSGAYGIPQALPGSKMATAGSDWRTNPATQITWAVGYMNDRYGSPCKAKVFKAANGWY